ncbi:MAG: methylamine utilization protein MauE [Burkholderiales bacterium]|nr:MAG: methylamine utilization protein MauE [Burkholderiales bacterium]
MTLLPPLDPILAHIAAASLAIVLLVAAAQKLFDRETFALALEQYRLLPERLVPGFALALPLAEAVAALLLLPVTSRAGGAAAALALLGLVTLAVTINLLRGRAHIDCGCGGSDGGQHLSWALVARNAVLALIALLAAAPTVPRELVWLDAITVAAAAVGLFGLYAAVNQLLANAPRLARNGP